MQSYLSYRYSIKTKGLACQSICLLNMIKLEQTIFLDFADVNFVERFSELSIRRCNWDNSDNVSYFPMKIYDVTLIRTV